MKQIYGGASTLADFAVDTVTGVEYNNWRTRRRIRTKRRTHMGSEKGFYIVKETVLGEEKGYLLKLDRSNRHLVVLCQVERSRLHDHFSIRKDFDPTPYVMFEEAKAFSCIFGSEKNPTPEGTFRVEFKTTEECVSGYYSASV